MIDNSDPSPDDNLVPYCKLYNTSKYGQVLVLLTDVEHPELKFFVRSPDTGGVCSTSLSWPEGDEWSKVAEDTFKLVDEERAIVVAEKICNSIVDVRSSLMR